MNSVTPAIPTALSERQILLLAAASAIVTANAYYIHPIIARVAEDFAVSAAIVGAVPALNQLALACGILLLLPLGDRFNNRRLVPLFLGAQTLLLVAMLLAQDYWVFVSASSLLGFFTITPYLLPAYVSKRVEATRLGHVTAILTTGVIAGVLISRAGSGVIAEYFGWRTVYAIASTLMLLATAILPLLMEDDPPSVVQQERSGYGALLLSLLPLLKTYPVVLLSGLMQGLSFGIFLCVWLGIGLHLTSPALGYGTDLVGGGFGSWAGTVAYDLAGWNGTAGLALLLSLLVLALALLAFRLPRLSP